MVKSIVVVRIYLEYSNDIERGWLIRVPILLYIRLNGFIYLNILLDYSVVI
jgi:hypothetical protein